MKKIIAMVMCLVLALSLVGCGGKIAENTNSTTPPKSEQELKMENEAEKALEEELKYKVATGEKLESCIDTISIDIDNDGVNEDCSMTYGPTSGLFTVVITASVNGTVKYKNTFNVAWGEVSFGEKDGIAQFVRDEEYHKLYVEDNRIVIDNLDPQYEGYWGDSNWNYDLK